ncbi:MAG: type 1 glutamine amidotransferase [Acidimicrobiales bacterium]
MPSCLVVQHVEPEGPYAIATALARAGVAVDLCSLPTGRTLPSSVEGYSGLVVMGGPMSAASGQDFPTKVRELALLGQALELRLPVLGVCLGAQLLAVAAGAHVYAGAEGPEVGWAPVWLTAEAASDQLFIGLPSELCVLHWHGDTFDLPPGAARLVSSTLYPNQALRVGSLAWGLQFHLEVDASAVRAFLAAFGGDAGESPNGARAIAEEAERALPKLALAQRLVLERFAGLVAGSAGREPVE